MFESTGLLLFWIASTYALATIITAFIQSVQTDTKALEKALHKRLDEIVHRVRVEKDKNTYYWYDMDNNKFLAQGSSDSEIINTLKARFPDHIFFLPTNHLICAKHDWVPKLIDKQ